MTRRTSSTPSPAGHVPHPVAPYQLGLFDTVLEEEDLADGTRSPCTDLQVAAAQGSVPADPGVEEGEAAPRPQGKAGEKYRATQPSVFPTPPEALRKSLDRCITFLLQHESSSGEEVLRQLLYLLYAKTYEEERSAGTCPGVFSPEGWGGPAQRGRLEALFEAMRSDCPGLFVGDERLGLADSTLSQLCTELGKHTLATTELDPLGVAFQFWQGRAARDRRAQFFSPLSASYYTVGMLAPGEDERVLEYACGAGVFLRALLAYRRLQLGIPLDASLAPNCGDGGAEGQAARLARYARTNVFGCELDASLARISAARLALAGGNPAHIYRMDSLAFPDRLDCPQAAVDIPLESVDILIGNPPYGSSLAIGDPGLLARYELAYQWKRQADNTFTRTASLQKRVDPGVLFLERALSWLKPGGRLGLILNHALLSAPSYQYVRAWLTQRAYVMASVGFPRGLFQSQSDVGLATDALFLRKKTQEELRADAITPPDYPVFMAVCEAMGFDSRGKTTYVRDAEGSIVKVDGLPLVNDELPTVLALYRDFYDRHRSRFPWEMRPPVRPST